MSVTVVIERPGTEEGEEHLGEYHGTGPVPRAGEEITIFAYDGKASPTWVVERVEWGLHNPGKHHGNSLDAYVYVRPKEGEDPLLHLVANIAWNRALEEVFVDGVTGLTAKQILARVQTLARTTDPANVARALAERGRLLAAIDAEPHGEKRDQMIDVARQLYDAAGGSIVDQAKSDVGIWQRLSGERG